MNIHLYKSHPEAFEAVAENLKRFEIRLDDRNPKVVTGDLVVLREFKPSPPCGDQDACVGGCWKDGEYTGRVRVRQVGYVARSHYLPPGWFGFELVAAPSLAVAELLTRYDGLTE